MNRLAWIYLTIMVAVVLILAARLIPVMLSAPVGYR